MTLWVISCFGLLTAMAFSHRLTTIEAHLVEHIDRQAQSLKGVLVSSAQDAVNAVTAQLVKAQREIVSRIAEVQAQLDAAGVAEQIDLSSLTAAAQALDDVVPDELLEEVVIEEPADVDAVVEPVDG